MHRNTLGTVKIRKWVGLWACLVSILFIGCKENTDSKEGAGSSESGVVNGESGIERHEAEAATERTKTILFFGNSLTAGMGLDTEEAFPALVQGRLDSLDMDYKVINAGLSGDTTASGLSRLDWVLEEEVDIFILELGANDGLRGIPLTETRKNLQAMIDKVKTKYPEATIILAGMQMPPNLGPEYTTTFKNIYPELAEANNLPLIPFLLDGVAGDPNLNQEDGIHPTAEGQKILMENVWRVLRPVLFKGDQ